MTRLAVAVLSGAVLAVLPAMGFGQTKTVVDQAEFLCCGQTATEDEAIDQMIQETQQNLQRFLMQSTTARRLPAGDYFISMSPDGYEFRAWVSRQGIVDGWNIADWEGVPIALMNTTGGAGGRADAVSYCTAKFSRDISGCAYLKGWPNRYQLCLNGAWDAFFSCLAGTSGGVMMR